MQSQGFGLARHGRNVPVPRCGAVFKVDETSYAEIVRQVRDEQFVREVHEREQALKREHEASAGSWSTSGLRMSCKQA